MNRIIKMTEHLSNKIAAGEVVDRPASVVKELVENSIDAESTEISIEIANSGKELIKIIDNGIGIHTMDISLIFERHATSKIFNDADIVSIKTLGFRGEALASIAAVSKIQIFSKRKCESFGFKLNLIKGSLLSHEKVNISEGTTISVNDLFFNVPARKKFLKSNQIETKAINQMIYRLTIANPNIKFKYIVDGRIEYITKGDGDIIQVLYNIYGKELINHIVHISYKFDNIKLDGYITDLNYYRGNRQMQNLFINKRYIENSTIVDNINNAYKSLIPIHKFPAFFINIAIDYKFVDVNIHPNKLLVKIENENNIGLILETELRKGLYRKKINTVFTTEEIADKQIQIEPTHNNINYVNDSFVRSEIINAEQQIFESFTNEIFEKSIESIERKNEIYNNLNYVGQILNTYLIFEKQQNIFLIDQHAAHEKILYERFMKSYRELNLSSQVLLVPELIHLSKDEFRIIENHSEALQRLAYMLEVFGDNEIIMRGIPTLFTLEQAKLMLLSIIDSLVNKNISIDILLETDIIQQSCKSAIKAHDSLENIEVLHLIEQLKVLKDPLTCPHGRPIIIEIDKNEIEKIFKRV